MGTDKRLSKWQLGLLLMGVFLMGLLSARFGVLMGMGSGAVAAFMAEKYGE